MKKKLIAQCVRIARSKCNPESHPEYYNFIHFSFVIQNNKILEYGFNRKGPPVEGFGYDQDFGKIHAENDAYRKAKGIIDSKKPFHVINIRLNKRGELRMSKPCNCCYAFLNAVGCKSVHFSTEMGFAKLNF